MEECPWYAHIVLFSSVCPAALIYGSTKRERVEEVNFFDSLSS
jgi:hypothetical protein